MFPQIAATDGQTASVVNGRARGRKNAWVITSPGDVRANFFAGGAIQDLLAAGTHSVITYFGESASASPGVEVKGAAVFDAEENDKPPVSSRPANRNYVW